MNRAANLEQLKKEHFDICIIGAGASGAGCALDAALRGFKVALIEKDDFASETSSKSTKLIHGGVRYLEQAFKNLDFAQLKQVKHGLEERHILLKNAPHLARPLALITPVFSAFEAIYYTIGLKLYGLFAKNDSMPKAQWLSKKETLRHIPTLSPKLHSSVMYYDGQLDDARYCLALAHSANSEGATVVNHASVLSFKKNNDGQITAAVIKDELDESNEVFEVKAKLFINCTGAKSDFIRLLANDSLQKCLRPSKGVHIMLPTEVLQSEDAMLIPKTKDGRVVFVIPFEGQVMVGTTDDAYENIEKEPILIEKEIDFILETLEPYLAKVPDKKQIKSGFGGLRPLIASSTSKATKKLVRDHEIEHDKSSNLLSLLGGKWTTYRLMAKETIDFASELLENEAICSTDNYLLTGAEGYSFEQWKYLEDKYQIEEASAKHLLLKYGNLAEKVLNTEKSDFYLQKLHPNFPYLRAEVIYAVRFEMAHTIRDFMARRIRLELLDWEASMTVASEIASLMAQELHWTEIQKELYCLNYQELLKEFAKNAGVA